MACVLQELDLYCHMIMQCPARISAWNSPCGIFNQLTAKRTKTSALYWLYFINIDLRRQQ